MRQLASRLGAKVVRIESENKVLYHLSAVFVCNLLSALLYTGEGIMKRIGIDLAPFYPIIRATLANIEAKGPLLSLTGPVVRGDAGTVASHLEAIGDMPLRKGVQGPVPGGPGDGRREGDADGGADRGAKGAPGRAIGRRYPSFQFQSMPPLKTPAFISLLIKRLASGKCLTMA